MIKRAIYDEPFRTKFSINIKQFLLGLFFLLSCILNAQINAFPYVEDFESGQAGWTVQGTNSSWAFSFPNGSVITGAASGFSSWVTNLNGDYNDNEDSWVQSPVFDLSSLTSPSIQLNIWWESEFSWDGAVLQSSIDGGVSWQNIGFFNDNINWYNDTSINGFPGDQAVGWSGRGASTGSQGWVTAINDLSSLIGETNVIFRIAFGADGSNTFDGFGFDLVSILDVPCYAGEDADDTVCSSIGVFDLTNYLSNNVGNGEWDSLDGAGISEAGEVDFSILNSGLFRFTYRVFTENGDCQDEALISITVEEFINISDTTYNICAGDLAFSFELEQALGDNDGNGQWNPNIDGGVGAGDYTYTISATSVCPEESATVTVIEDEPVFAGFENGGVGSNGAPIDECDLNFINLNSKLSPSATLNGTWSQIFDAETDGGAVDSINELTGAVDFPDNGAGSFVYKFKYAVANTCNEDESFFKYTINVSSSAGTNSELIICPGDLVFENELLEAIGNPEPNGSWNVDVSGGVGLGTYTYTQGDCGGDFATVEVKLLTAGDNFFAALCNPTIIDLDDFLSTDAILGGVWQTGSGAGDLSISEDGIVDVSSKNQQTVSFSYTVTSEDNNCSDIAFISFEIDRISAGVNSILDICSGSTVTEDDLFNALLGEPTTGGTWSPALSGAGIYTYTQLANFGCPEQTATVVVNEFNALSAGNDEGTDECKDPGTLNLRSILTSGANIGGSWTQIEGATADLRPNGNVDFPDNGAGNFTYKFSYSFSACGGNPESEATITVNIDVPNSAGEDGTLQICSGDTLTESQLFGALNGNPDEFGIWSPALLGAGVYTYTQGDSNGCNNSANVTVVEETALSAGSNGTLEINVGDTVTELQLFNALQGSPDSGGVWTPVLAGAGRTYTHENGSCNVTSSEVVVTEETLSIDNLKDAFNSLKLYPNPGKDLINLSGNVSFIESITVYSVSGKLVLIKKNNFNEIDIRNLEPAVYFVSIKSNIGNKVLKLIKI